MKLVLICGAWGSGTSVATGALVRLGYHAPGPFFLSNDPRTPNTYECLPFIELVRKLVSDTTLQLSVPSRDVVLEELAAFKETFLRQACRQRGVSEDGPVVLKHPLSAVILNEITRVFDARLIVLLRPLDQIEETRRRRNWSAVYGEAGAKLVYTHIFNHIVLCDTPAMVVKYSELVKHPQDCLEDMERFIHRGHTHGRREDALSFIGRPASEKPDAAG